MEKVSVIITNHNRARYIGAIIETLMLGHHKIHELTIVDDASTDDSINLIHQMLQSTPFKVNIVQNSRRLGTAASRNKGIQQSTGDLLLFIDSDLRFDPSCIEKLINGIQGFDISFPQVLYETGSILNPLNNFERERAMNSVMFIIRKKSLLKMDMDFDELMNIYREDSDFFLRAYAFGLKSNYIEEAKAYHPVKAVFSEESYFYRVKNTIYLFLKLRGFVKYRHPFIAYVGWFLFIFLLTALLNRHFHGCRPTGIRYASNRLGLLKLYFKSIYWNISVYKTISKHRHRIDMMLNKRSPCL